MAGVFVPDRAGILERLGGDEYIYTMMVDMYIQDVERNCATLAAALAAGEPLALRREVHTVKGLLATFSDDEGAAEALLVERLIQGGAADVLAAAVGRLQVRLREVAIALKVAG